MMGIKQYIYIALSIVIIGYIYSRESTINSLEVDKANLEKAVIVSSVNFIECDETITEQNEAIDILAIDYDSSVSEFNEYKKLPPKIKIKKERIIIYKDVNITKPREERDCEDYKNIERNTYLIDWNN